MTESVGQSTALPPGSPHWRRCPRAAAARTAGDLRRRRGEPAGPKPQNRFSHPFARREARSSGVGFSLCAEGIVSLIASIGADHQPIADFCVAISTYIDRVAPLAPHRNRWSHGWTPRVVAAALTVDPVNLGGPIDVQSGH